MTARPHARRGAPGKKSAPRCVTSRGHGTRHKGARMLAESTAAGGRTKRLRRADALEDVATAATMVCAVLDAMDVAGTAALAHQRLAVALDNLGQSSRSRGRSKDDKPKVRSDLDARGFKRPESCQPGHRAGQPPRNKGRKYPASPPTAAEAFLLMRSCPETPHGRRLRGLIVLLWRTGMRISEALALVEDDLDRRAGAITIRSGKGGKRRVVGMDRWAWDELAPWLDERKTYPPGPVFCVLTGPTAGRAWSYPDVSNKLRQLGRDCGLRRRIAAHQFRHMMTIEWIREGRSLAYLQRQLGHTNLAVTTSYVASLSSEEVIEQSLDRAAPMLPMPDLMEILRG
jgi:integrase